ncbi:unnamed protein product [Linum trigynum]|uniref:Uncharacterized protein n=1 Tax=Linum trigynum TaxID=586398 RepID=A0AAV2FD48_9ROSI
MRVTVLLLHRGPLQELSLSLPILRSFPAEIDQILLFLQEKGIDNLTITMERLPFEKIYEDYSPPMRLFSQLKVLRSCCCQFTTSPVSFECFSMLNVLELRNVSVNYSFNYPTRPYSTSSAAASPSDPPKPSSLSARISFVFDQIDAIERERAEKHETL